jgi:hypothetical protein
MDSTSHKTRSQLTGSSSCGKYHNFGQDAKLIDKRADG